MVYVVDENQEGYLGRGGPPWSSEGLSPTLGFRAQVLRGRGAPTSGCEKGTHTIWVRRKAAGNTGVFLKGWHTDSFAGTLSSCRGMMAWKVPEISSDSLSRVAPG